MPARLALCTVSDFMKLDTDNPLLRRAACDGVIDALKVVLSEELGEAGVCSVVLGDDDEASGVFVNAMDDAGARDAANAGERVRAMREQRIHDRPAHRARRGVHGHAAGFVDDDEMLVLVDDVER